jgi:hypothetical protein
MLLHGFKPTGCLYRQVTAGTTRWRVSSQRFAEPDFRPYRTQVVQLGGIRWTPLRLLVFGAKRKGDQHRYAVASLLGLRKRTAEWFDPRAINHFSQSFAFFGVLLVVGDHLINRGQCFGVV